jgi:hypothetical protein
VNRALISAVVLMRMGASRWSNAFSTSPLKAWWVPEVRHRDPRSRLDDCAVHDDQRHVAGVERRFGDDALRVVERVERAA